jgi:alanine racemase
MSRPTQATISVAAMRHNLARARAEVRGARVWAVVKANGYGHGLMNALRGFADADGLALVEFDLAVRLREAGWRGPILMLEGAFDAGDVRAAGEHRLGLVIHHDEQLEWLSALGQAVLPDLFLKFNSGMSRLGFDASGLRAAHARLAGHPGAASLTLMTHFANADLPGGATDALERFETACRGLSGARSTANSAAILDLPQAHADAVRPGIMLYGASPFAGRSAAQLGLRPAMKLSSKLIAVQRLSAGDAVGYGSTFVADAPMRIGVVACGYADGYPRHAPTGTPIAVDGVRTRTVGRVAMDMLMVDLEPVPAAGVGSAVELWGEEVPIDEVASSAGTIGYELMCALAPRVLIRAED